MLASLPMVRHPASLPVRVPSPEPVPWGLEGISFKLGSSVSFSAAHLKYEPCPLSQIFKRTSPLLYIELKGGWHLSVMVSHHYIGANLRIDAAQVQPSYTVRTPRASVPTSTASKLPLVLRILQLPFVQKFLVFCLRAFELSISDTRVEVAHEVRSYLTDMRSLIPLFAGRLPCLRCGRSAACHAAEC